MSSGNLSLFNFIRYRSNRTSIILLVPLEWAAAAMQALVFSPLFSPSPPPAYAWFPFPLCHWVLLLHLALPIPEPAKLHGPDGRPTIRRSNCPSYAQMIPCHSLLTSPQLSLHYSLTFTPRPSKSVITTYGFCLQNCSHDTNFPPQLSVAMLT